MIADRDSDAWLCLAAGRSYLDLPDGEVHLWCLDQDEIGGDSRAEYLALLSAEEVEQAGRYRFAADARRFIATRALVRTTLSQYYPVAPATWRFDRTALGRPLLKPLGTLRPPAFSVSHTTDLILFALAHEAALGIDVEKTNVLAPLTIARKYFCAEEVQAIEYAPPEAGAQLFFRYWTLKEAFLKATGHGLHWPLNSVSFRIRHGCSIEATYATPVEQDRRSNQFWLLQPTPEHIAAVCVQRRPDQGSWRIRFWKSVPLLSRHAWSCPEVARSIWSPAVTP
jgi:4'-phosphopantetheinyl transferase